MLRYVSLVSWVLMLSACTSDIARAPVVNGWHQPSAATEAYVVRSGDTLYSIAWAFGLDYRSLAEVNHLRPPYALSAGQRLKMTSIPHDASKTTIQKSTSEQTVQNTNPYMKSISDWHWPTRGTLVSRFSTSASGYRGIEIAGQLGQSISASAPGEVVYSGAGVKGYGNLIIIKHNETFLSAYGFNQKRLVKLGDHVKTGQEIALMGRNNAGKVVLYFEIRKNGKPVNPQEYLR